MIRWWFIALFLFFCGCATLGIETEQQIKAGKIIKLAEKFEQSGTLTDATALYVQVAENFPKTRHYKKAARKAGLLYLNPKNPEMDIETSLHWFRSYNDLPLVQHEKENIEALITLLESIKNIEGKYAEIGNTNKNLEKKLLNKSKALEHLSKENVSNQNRVDELQKGLDQALEALSRLKEIDKQLHDNRIGR